MAQTLNFNVQIDQSQIPSAIQQIQSGINTQLQAGAMQLGTMASGLGNTMAAMNSMGVHPGAMGFPYAVAPGTINHTLGKMPFQDRTASIVEFMRNSQQAVISRASSIVSSMDPSKIVPSLTASRGSRMLEFGINTAGTMGLSMGASAIGSKILAGMALSNPVAAIAGFGVSALAYFGAGKAMAPISRSISRMLGTDGYPKTEEEIQKLTLERKSYADLAAGFMAMGPQKYLPKLGQKINVESQVRFGEAISKAFMTHAETTGSIVSRAAGQNTGYAVSTLNALQIMDPLGFKKNVGGIFKNLGATSYAPTAEEQRKLTSYFNESERTAQKIGFKSLVDENIQTVFSLTKAGANIFGERYTGPSTHTLMGRQLGSKSRMGSKFGGALFDAFSSRSRKDLDMSNEELGWLGGRQGISQMYGSMMLSESATMGSMTDIGLAALKNGGGMNNVYDMTYAAAGTFSDPKQYVKYRLNRKEYMRQAGGKGVDAIFRRSKQMQAEEAMRVMPGVWDSRYDALRFNFMSEGMDDESATAMAGMIENKGKTIQLTGGSDKISLWDSVVGDAKQKEAARQLLIKNYTDSVRGASKDDAEKALRSKIWSRSSMLQGSKLAIGDTFMAGLMRKYYNDPKSLTKEEIAAVEKEKKILTGGKAENEEVLKQNILGKNMDKDPISLQTAVANEFMIKNSFRNDPTFAMATKGNIETMMAIKNIGKEGVEKLQSLSKRYAEATDEDVRNNIVQESARLFGKDLEKGGFDRFSGARAILEAGFTGTAKDLEALNKKNFHFADDGMSGSGDVDKEIAEALMGVSATFAKLASKMEKR